MKSLLKSTILLTLCLASTAIFAQDADKIIDNYIKAIGGAEKLSAITTMKMIGESEGPRGKSGLTMIQKAPNKNKMLINAMGTEMTMAFDGETAWMINPWAGGAPTKMEGDQAKMIPQDELENPFLNYADKGHTVKLLGEEDVDDETHYKVRLTTKDGKEMVYYFHAESSLPTQMKMLLTEGQAKGSILVVTMSDYKKVGDYTMPHITDRMIDGNSMGKFVISKIEVNEEIADSEFAFPDENKE